MKKSILAVALLSLTAAAFADNSSVHGGTNVSNQISGGTFSSGTGTSISGAMNSQSAQTTFQQVNTNVAGTKSTELIGTTSTAGQAYAFNQSTGGATGAAVSTGNSSANLDANATVKNGGTPCRPNQITFGGASDALSSNTIVAGPNQGGASVSNTNSGFDVKGSVTNTNVDGTLVQGVSDIKTGFSNTVTQNWNGSSGLAAASVQAPGNLANPFVNNVTGGGTFNGFANGSTTFPRH